MRGVLSFAIVLAVLAAAGCGARQQPEEPSRIELLRRRAANHPNDPAIQRELAEAELLAADGDIGRAEAQIGRALKLSPEDPVLLLLAALERDLHGDLDAALERSLQAVEAARGSDAATAPYVAEVGVGIVSDLVDVVSDYPTRVRGPLEALVRSPGGAGPGAQALAGGVLMRLAQRQGELDKAQETAGRLGCIPSWRVAGPFGPRDLLGFDRAHPALAEGPLAAEYDLGPDREVQPTRELETRGCLVRLGADSSVSEGGTTYAEAFVEVGAERAGEHVLRLETPNAVELYLDGERVVRLDSRRHPVPRITYHPLSLSEGEHEVTVKIATRHPNPILDVALLPTGMKPELELGSPLGVYLRASVAFGRGDVVTARELLQPYGEAEGSPLVLMLASSVALSDPLRPGDMRRDGARRLLAAAAEGDARAWLPQLQVARLAAADDQLVKAIDRLREAVEKWPKVLTLRLALEDMLLNKGLEAEAYRVAEQAYELAPDTCPAIATMLSAERRRDHVMRAQELIDELVECNARNDARLDNLVARREWDAAVKELERLAALEPPQSATQIKLRRLRIARGRGDRKLVQQLVSELADENPDAAGYRLELADRHRAAGRTRKALQVLEEAIVDDPGGMAGLRWAQRVLGGESEIDRWRVDGAEVLEEFEASGQSYDAPQVLVWDYMAARVFEDGSSFELVHQIYKVQSEEAVDEQGEFAPPGGARLLSLHTIKADGTRLEPDRIGGKNTISLPSLAPGDYVEYEYVRFKSGPGGMPGAVLGPRFFFRNFETPFHRSEYQVVVPEGTDLQVSPRGEAPETLRRTDGGLDIYEWKVKASEPLVREPMSVSPREWIPSIAWGIDARWDLFVGGLLDGLVDKDVVDPSARRLARRVLGPARRGDDLARARRLYHWVLENVEDNNSVFGQAAPMLAQRTGERHRILRYLLGLVGIESKLVLARSIASDQTRSEVADDDTYQNLLLMVEPEGKDPVFLAMGKRGAPFGYVPAGTRGQEALVIAPGAPRVTVPEGRPDSTDLEMTIRLGEDGSARVSMVEVHRGAGAVSWRDNLEGIPAAVLEERFDEGYVSRLMPGAQLAQLEIENREAPEKPFVLRYVFDVPILGRRQGGKWVLPAPLPPQLASKYASIASRTTTQVVAPPVHRDFVIQVQVPSGVRLPAAWQPVGLDGPKGARFEMAFDREGRTLTIRRRLRIPVMRVSPKAYSAWATFCRSVDQAAGREIPLGL